MCLLIQIYFKNSVTDFIFYPHLCIIAGLYHISVNLELCRISHIGYSFQISAGRLKCSFPSFTRVEYREYIISMLKPLLPTFYHFLGYFNTTLSVSNVTHLI